MGYKISTNYIICVCHQKNSIEHALSCKIGGFVTLRHNELRDITADVVSEVCKDKTREPILEPTLIDNANNQKSSNTSDEARADLSMLGLWQRGQRAFVDVRIFNPFATSYRNQSLNSTFKKIEATKKREYNRRIMYNDHGTFTPLLFSINGGLSRETSTFYSRVAELLAIKRNSTKAETITWLRRKISFNLIRSSVLCLRGTRNYKMTDQNQIFDSDIKISNLNSILD